MAGSQTSTALLALLAIFVGLFLLRAFCRGGLLRGAIVAACVAIPTASFLTLRGLGGRVAPYAETQSSIAAVSSADGAAARSSVPAPRIARHGAHGAAQATREAPSAVADDVFANMNFEFVDPSDVSDGIGEPPPPDETERWKGLVSALLGGISREMVERRWADSPPLTVSLGDDLIVIGQAELQAEREIDGSSRRERDRAAKLRLQTDRAALESARRQLGEYIVQIRAEATPALRDVARTLRGLSDSEARGIADRILDQYEPAARESTDFAAGAQRPVLRHAYKYEIGGDRFMSNLRDELVRIERSAREARARGRGDRPLHGLLTAAIIWAVIVASAATLRASTRRRASA